MRRTISFLETVHILGVSAFYHDSAACLLRDGTIVAAAQEERFTRKKHDSSFPRNAVDYCLRQAGLPKEKIDYIVYYEKPLLKFDRLLETYLAYAPRGFKIFTKGFPLWVKQKLHIRREIRKSLELDSDRPLLFLEHHESHAASAFFPSPFEEAAIVTLDGVGEWACGSIGMGTRNRISLLEEMRFPHSLGLLYSAFTYFTGFRVNSGEYKLMGLAPYGEPKYVQTILDELLDLKDDGSFRLNMSYFAFGYRDVMTSERMDRLFGGPPRQAGAEITQREMDLAASIQAVTEEIVLRTARHTHRLTSMDNLTLAGGVALNCVANGRLLREGPFDRIWVQPAAGDAGGALGAALFAYYQIMGNNRSSDAEDHQSGSYLGPSFDVDQVSDFLDRAGATYEHIVDEDQLLDRVASLLGQGNVVGHMFGRMEFGPRALGNRSILGDARNVEMQSVMNLKIKFRESFRPFAPAVLLERAPDYFEMDHIDESPYMLVVTQVADGIRKKPKNDVRGIRRVALARSELPAITHVDYSARLQTLTHSRNHRFYSLVKRFEEQTGCGALVNTSFNVRGEPIVCTPEDAYRCFMATDMDALVIENFLLLKENQQGDRVVHRETHLAQFELD